MRIKSVSLYEHSQRVSNLAAATAIYMRLTANEITLIRNAGLLHDIGLICVPNHVLTNYPYVSKRDIQVYKRHPDLGANILESCPVPAWRISFLLFVSTMNVGMAQDIRNI